MCSGYGDRFGAANSVGSRFRDTIDSGRLWPGGNVHVESLIFLIGDELLAGELVDRNGPWLAEWLQEEGLRTREIRILPDEASTIRDALAASLGPDRLVLVVGGLGPTSDDRTTEAVADALGVGFELAEAQWERIRQAFAAMDRTPPPGNEKQAMLPTGAEVLPNEQGTAPGYAIVTSSGGLLAVLPGPPKENRPMVTEGLSPWLARQAPDRRRRVTRVWRTFGLPESEVGHRLRALEAELPEVDVAYQFKFPEILVKLRVAKERVELLGSAEEKLAELLGPHLYGRDEAVLPEVVGRMLAERGWMIATAESCTAGLAAKLLTDPAGSSAWMERGFVTYTNEAKTELLGVPRDLIAEHGAVSEPVARAMAAGALAHSDADVAIGITGVAGPAGGTDEKPVGTVCIGWGDRDHQEARTHHFHWDRDYNRRISVWAAFYRIYRMLNG